MTPSAARLAEAGRIGRGAEHADDHRRRVAAVALARRRAARHAASRATVGPRSASTRRRTRRSASNSFGPQPPPRWTGSGRCTGLGSAHAGSKWTYRRRTRPRPWSTARAWRAPSRAPWPAGLPTGSRGSPAPRGSTRSRCRPATRPPERWSSEAICLAVQSGSRWPIRHDAGAHLQRRRHRRRHRQGVEHVVHAPVVVGQRVRRRTPGPRRVAGWPGCGCARGTRATRSRGPRPRGPGATGWIVRSRQKLVMPTFTTRPIRFAGRARPNTARQRSLLDLPRFRPGDLVDVVDGLGRLVPGQQAATVGDQPLGLLGARLDAIGRRDDRLDLLAELVVGHADHRGHRRRRGAPAARPRSRPDRCSPRRR